MRQPYSIEILPDECLFEILRRLPGSLERRTASRVSKRWLMILSSIRPSGDMLLRLSRKPLLDLNYSTPFVFDLNSDIRSDGYLTRYLEEEEATDIRLAAVSVCTAGNGGLDTLKIRGGNTNCKVTDVGLSTIACGCPFLRVLSIWKLPLITDAGLVSIANGCPLLENLDICQCPLISDKGLIAISKKCSNLTCFAIDSCPGIGDDGLKAVGCGCTKLISISIKDCPLVGDKGISNVVTHTSSSLKKIKLQNVNVSDVSLAVIGHYAKAVTNISLTSLLNVSERGFWVMGNAGNMVSLTSCTLSCCPGVTDRSLEAIANRCPRLKKLSIRMSSNLSDSGLQSLTVFASMLECLQLEDCNRVTLVGVLNSILIGYTRFKSLTLVKCLGIRDIPFHHIVEVPKCMSLQSLTIRDCPGFTTFSLSVIGKICPKLRGIDLCRLVGVTDAGLLPLVETSKSGLVEVNLEGCLNLSDASVCALVESHGSSLKSLNLDGCVKITDRTLLSISANCSVLEDLNVSRCSLSDLGVAAIASAKQLNLRTLCFSGCSGVTKRSLPYLGRMKECLEGLNLQQCKVIKTHGVRSLEEKLWWCEILS